MEDNLPEFDETEEVLPSFEDTEGLPSQTEATMGAVEPLVDQPGPMDNIEAGLRSFLNNIPGYKQGSAGIKAAADTSTDLSFAQKYRMYLDTNKFQDKQVQNTYPNSYLAGEVATYVGPGGSLAKGVQAIPKIGLLFKAKEGVKLTSKTIGYAQTIGRNAVADTALIASRDILDKELSDIGDIGELTANVFVQEAINNSIGAVAGLAMNIPIHAVQSGATRIYNSEAFKLAQEYVQGKTKKAAQALRELNKEVGSEYVEKTLKNAGIDRTDFSPESFKAAIKSRKDEIGTVLEDSYTKMDEMVGGTTIPIDDLYARIQGTVRSYYSKGNTKAGAELQEQILGNLKREFFESGRMSPLLDAAGKPIQNAPMVIEKSISDIWGFRKMFNDEAAGARMLGANVPDELTKLIGGDITAYLKGASNKAASKFLKESGANMADEGSKAFIKGVRELGETITENNKEYRTILKFQDNVVDGLKLPDPETVKGAFARNLVTGGSATVGTLTYFASHNSLLAGASAVTVAGLRTINQKSDTIMRQLGEGPNSTIGKLMKVSDQFYKNFNDPYVSSLIPSFVRAANDEGVSDAEFGDLVHDYNSRMNLYSNTIERNDEDVKRKLDDIMNIAGRVNPELAKQLSYTREMGDDMGPIMDQLSKSPEMARFFSPGLGWNGRVYSEEDKAALISQLQGVYVNSGLTSQERRKLESDIINKGIIPQILKGE